MAYQKNFAGVPFKTLLDKAHKQYGLAGVETEILQFPCAENGNMAIFRATVKNSDGATFSGHGDADPKNTTSTIAPHLLRMAETRAIARALRWLTNSGETAIVEISGDEDESGPSGPSQTPPDEPDPSHLFLNACDEIAKKIDDEDQVAIVLTTCGYDNLAEVHEEDFRRVYDALKEKRTELDEKRAATKLAAN